MHILDYIEACKSSRGIEILLTIETTKRDRHLPQYHRIPHNNVYAGIIERARLRVIGSIELTDESNCLVCKSSI